MSAAKTIRMAEASGIRLGVKGADLILDAKLEPPVDVVKAIRKYKAEIIELLATPRDRWTAEDWQAFFGKRAGIAKFDDGLPRPEAEARAFDCCITVWLNRHPQHSDPGRCAWCENPETAGAVVVPFGTETYGHTWLHHDCWKEWSEYRRRQAAKALAQLGIATSSPIKATDIKGTVNERFQ